MNKVLQTAVFFCFLSTGIPTLAQVDRSPQPISEAEGNIGKAISDYASLISPDAFKGKWEKDLNDWIQTVSQYGINNIGDAKDKISELINSLKGSALPSDAKASLLLQTVGANGADDIRKILSGLLEALDPALVTGQAPTKMDLPEEPMPLDSLKSENSSQPINNL